MASSFTFLVHCMFAALVTYVPARAAIVEHTFHIANTAVRMFGEERAIVVVNGRMPGPSIVAHEGDTVIIHVLNESPYNMSLHWHGILQKQSAWSDGPAYVTQCPIRPGRNFTYEYRVVEQEGTLWYHAHVSFLRATVYGALIILPRLGYPFPKPYKEIPILLGEWWNDNVVDVEAAALAAGGQPVHADAFTINGKPGHLYSSSKEEVDDTNMWKIGGILQGKTYLLRIINAGLGAQFFLRVGGHNLTVVAADAAYTNPYTTDMVVLAPGQTIDALLLADAPPSSYYIAASHYFSAHDLPLPDILPTTALLRYHQPTTSNISIGGRRKGRVVHGPLMPILPDPRDIVAAHSFYGALTALVTPNTKPINRVPVDMDVKMLVTLGLGFMPCGKEQTCEPPMTGKQVVGSMNNVSFELPTSLSMLEAHYHGVDGVFTADFPDRPPVEFDYVDPGVREELCRPVKGTRLKRLKYGSRVEVVLQATAILGVESHPIHLHGYNFFVVAQGFGNYDEQKMNTKLNLLNPLVRNTVAVPAGGWAVIRFVADNPGVWIMHCHLDLHLSLGLGTAFVVEDGATPSSALPPPPPHLPRC